MSKEQHWEQSHQEAINKGSLSDCIWNHSFIYSFRHQKRKYCLWRRFLQFWVCADWSRKLQTCLSYSLYNDVLCLSVFMHDFKFSVSVLLKLCVRICSLCTMAEERTVSRCLMVRVEISETSLADPKQFVTEKGGKLIDGKCLQWQPLCISWY